MTFTCPSSIPDQLLSVYDLTSDQLDNITSLTAQGPTATSTGPFTSLPPNICLMSNLQVNKFSLTYFSIKLKSF